MRDSDFTREMAMEGSKIVAEYLKNPKAEGSPKVELAIRAVQAHAKMRATDANDDTNKVGLAKLIYNDAGSREEYFKRTMPYMMIEDKKKK